jgi:hypothetical protein
LIIETEKTLLDPTAIPNIRDAQFINDPRRELSVVRRGPHAIHTSGYILTNRHAANGLSEHFDGANL